MSNSTTPTNPAAAYAAYLTWVTGTVNSYFYIVSTAIGVPFNSIAIFIFWRLMGNKTNMGFLGILQSIADMTVLVYFLLVYRSSQVFGVNVGNLNEFACRFLATYLRRIVLHLSSWITVLTTFDRFIFVLYGHGQRFKFLKKKTYLALILLGITIFICICDIPNLLFSANTGSCTGDTIATLSSDIVSICLRTYIPTILMATFNIFMIRKIFKTNRRVLNQTSLSRKEYQFTLAVMAYDVYFFVLNFPLSAYYIINNISSITTEAKSQPVSWAVYNMGNSLTTDFAFLIQTFSLITNLIFNKQFRFEFLRVLGKILHIDLAGRVGPAGPPGHTHSLHTFNNTTH